MSRALAVASVAAFFALLVAGCSGGGKSPQDGSGAGAETNGVILGVVVDQAIRPVEDARVSIALPSGGARETSTDGEGRFTFDDLQPGTYFVTARHLLYRGSQASVEVKAGVDDPPVLRIQVERLFEQEPYSVPIKFEGYIQCGYSLPAIRTQCVDDYSRFVIPGGCCPELREVFDHRAYLAAVDGGWQTLVYELAWTPSAQGTSEELFLVVTHYNRTGTHAFALTEGPSPLLIRIEVGKQARGAVGGEPSEIEPEGRGDVFTYAGVGGDTAVGFSQEFTIIQHTFYHGKPPEDWSFIAGDEPPF